jgi:hypothetical protein
VQPFDRVPDVERVRLMRAMIPELFSEPGRILYVGAHRGGFAMSAPLHQAGNKITVLDVWEPALKELQKIPCGQRAERFVLGDVRRLSDTGLTGFDYSVWLNGPEHIEFGDLPGALAGLEAVTRKTVVLACPWGKAPHGWKENPNNKHVSFLEPNDFFRLGYQVAALSPIDQLGGYVLAWKRKEDNV